MPNIVQNCPKIVQNCPNIAKNCPKMSKNYQILSFLTIWPTVDHARDKFMGHEKCSIPLCLFKCLWAKWGKTSQNSSFDFSISLKKGLISCQIFSFYSFCFSGKLLCPYLTTHQNWENVLEKKCERGLNLLESCLSALALEIRL